jgi:hypothetical protein
MNISITILAALVLYGVHTSKDIAADKKAHFFLGFIVSVLASAAILNPIYGFLFGIIFGAVKELRDMYGYGTPEWADMIYTALGSALGSIWLYITLLPNFS